MAGALPDWRIVVIALLYSVGAHGIMTLNDFKSVEGDKRMGIDSLPVLLGVERAARFACLVMAVPQVVVVGAAAGMAAAVLRGGCRRVADRPIVPDGPFPAKPARAGALVQRNRDQLSTCWAC